MSEANAGKGGIALRLATFFGALFLIHGVHLTYLPVWLDARGLSATEIAVASSAPMFVRLLVTPAIAFAADRASAHRRFIITACTCALVLMLALSGARQPLVLMGLVIAMTISLQTIMPMLDTITLAAVKAQGLDYGRIRLWGSAAFIVASYIAGFSVTGFGPEAVLVLSIAAAALTTVASLMLPRPPADGGPSASRKRLTLADAVGLARDRGFMLFVLTVGAIQASHAVLYVFGVLHWRDQGLSGGFIATLWAIGVVAEIALFWASRWIVPLGAVQLMMFGACAGLIRWLALASDPGPAWLLPLQVLHAGTFAATHLGAMQWIATRVPHSTAGTAQALLSTFTTGIAMGGAMLMSGPLYTLFAGRAYLAMVALCSIGLVAALVLRHRDGSAQHAS